MTNYDIHATTTDKSAERFHVTAPDSHAAIAEAEKHLFRAGWDHGDLERAVIGARPVDRPAPDRLSGCTCGGIGTTGSHRPPCQWAAAG